MRFEGEYQGILANIRLPDLLHKFQISTDCMDLLPESPQMMLRNGRKASTGISK